MVNEPLGKFCHITCQARLRIIKALEIRNSEQLKDQMIQCLLPKLTDIVKKMPTYHDTLFNIVNTMDTAPILEQITASYSLIRI